MLYKNFKELAKQVGGEEKALVILDGEEIVDETGAVVKVELSTEVVEEVVEEEVADEVATAKSLDAMIEKKLDAKIKKVEKHFAPKKQEVKVKVKSLTDMVYDSINKRVDNNFEYVQKYTDDFNSENSGPEGQYLTTQANTEPVFDIFDSEILSRVKSFVVPQQILNLLSIPYATGQILEIAAQGDAIAENELVYDTNPLQLKLQAGIINFSNELFADAPNVARQVTDILTRDLSRRLETMVMTIVKAGVANIDVNRAVANQIAQADVLGMFSKLWAGNRYRDAFWAYNPSTVTQLFPLIDSGQGAWDGSKTPANTLLGLPLVPCTNCAALGTKDDLMLISGDNVALATSGGPKQERSTDYLFNWHLTSAKLSVRAASAIVNDNAIVEGGVTYSQIVTLDVPVV